MVTRIMFEKLVTASLLLCFLTVFASCQQHLKGVHLDNVAHVDAFPMNPLSAMSDSLSSVQGSESMSAIALEESLSGYIVEATYTDTTCKTFLSAYLSPLNTCMYRYDLLTGSRYNVKVIATSSTWLVQYFNDVECAVMATSSVNAKQSPYQKTCGQGTRSGDGMLMFVQPSKEVATSQSLVYTR